MITKSPETAQASGDGDDYVKKGTEDLERYLKQRSPGAPPEDEEPSVSQTRNFTLAMAVKLGGLSAPIVLPEDASYIIPWGNLVG